MNKKKVVLLGGGHGLSAIINSFIDQDLETSIIVSTTDNGGHTGLLRKEFDVPALGDIRRCLVELIKDPTLKNLFSHRFNIIHDIENVSLGNLMLLSLIDNDLETTLLKLKDTLKLDATILPSLNYASDIYAKYEDGEIVKGEENIPSNKKIKDIFYKEKVEITNNVRKVLEEADYIVISPGSLYTSILPILAIEQIQNIIKKSKAKLMYISNIMTQHKETDNYTILDIVKVIEKKIRKKLDVIISSSSPIDLDKIENYSQEFSYPINKSKDKRIKYYDLLDDVCKQIRHDYKKLKEAIKKEM